MMSAPSAPRRSAWARPCPRAAPVISATLPESDWLMGPLNSFLGRLVAEDLVEWVGSFEHAVALLAVPPVAHARLLHRGEAGHLLFEGLHRVHVVVVMNVVGGKHGLAGDLDVADVAVTGFQYQRDVLA